MPSFVVVKVAKSGTIQQALSAEGAKSLPGDALCYEVSKKEVVSPKKVVALLRRGQSSGRLIVGREAREKVGLSIGGKGTVVASDAPAGFSLFVQSTSSNRKMPAGSLVLLLRDGGGGADVKGMRRAGPMRAMRSPSSTMKTMKTSTAATKAMKVGSTKRPASRSASAKAAETSGKRAKIVDSSPKSDTVEAAAPSSKLKGGSSAWTKLGSLYFRDYGSPASEGVAGFDMDSTLIKTKSGKTFAKSKDDWTFWAPEVVPKLRELSRKGRKIVIITNQGGVAKGKAGLADIQSKIDAVQHAADVPMLAMALTEDDIYRKPLPMAWTLMESKFNGRAKVSKTKSFYCGDAAGREPPTVKKKDFSANDLKFALNVGVKFFTPEELFLNKSQTYQRDHFAFDPRRLGVKPLKYPVPMLKKQTLVLTIGPPGSGKSATATQHFQKAVRVNQDTLKTKGKCLKVCEDALQKGLSVVVDNQNRAKVDRAPFLAVAKKVGVPAIAVFFDVPKELCFHLNTYRMLNTSSRLHRPEKVPSMIVHGFYKYVEQPKATEGFDAVYRFGMEHFAPDDDANLSLLRSFLG